MVYFFIIFSFLFESAFSNLVNMNGILLPLFLLTSLVILYPYFNNKKVTFIITCLVCGLIYDISFADSIFINTISFSICSIITVLGYNYINYNIFNSNFLNILIITLYRIISYLLLCIVDYIKFNEATLIKGIYNSLIINLIYGIVLYFIAEKSSKIFKIKKIE